MSTRDLQLIDESGAVISESGVDDVAAATATAPATVPTTAPADESATDKVTQTLDDLRIKAAGKFSTAEIENFIKLGKVMTSKAILSAVVCVVMEGPSKGFARDEADRLKKKIEKLITEKGAGYTQVAFRETSMKLNICLSLVDRQYKTDISIPSTDYARDLFRQYDFIKNTAVAYWRQFAQENPSLYKRICDYRSDVDFSELTIDEKNPTTLYFDPACAKRVGIFCYYVDEDGNAYYKKKQ